MKNMDNYQNYDDDISFRKVVIFISYCFSLIRKNFVLIILFVFLGVLTGYFITTFNTPKYKSELRFVVKNEGSTGLGGMLGGLNSVLGGSSMGSTLERTVEIASSDRIIGAVLLSKIFTQGKYEILANTLIEINNLHAAWAKDTLMSHLYFNSEDTSIENLSFSKRKAIKYMEDLLFPKSGTGIINRSIDKKSGVVTLTATHENEEFAIILTKEIFNKLRDFYVEQMTTSATNNVSIFQRKVDSIKLELSKVQSSFARNTDQSFGLLFQEDKVELKKLAVREQMLIAMYAEAQKNLETFRFMNDSAIPSLTVIDMPYSPLKKIQRSKLLFSFVGGFLGSILIFLIILLRAWYKRIMTI